MPAKIKNMTQYQELAELLQEAMETLVTASTQGAHYMLISYLKTNLDIATNSREGAMKTARKLLDDFDFTTMGSTAEMDKYAKMAEKLKDE